MIYFEIEAAGYTDGFPCLVIRDVSDDVDSYKKLEMATLCCCRSYCMCKTTFTVDSSTICEKDLEPMSSSE